MKTDRQPPNDLVNPATVDRFEDVAAAAVALPRAADCCTALGKAFTLR
jgi:hypothetical protein